MRLVKERLWPPIARAALSPAAWFFGVVWVSAACAGITGQAAFGLAQGVIFQRTRNLLAGSILHMLFDLP